MNEQEPKKCTGCENDEWIYEPIDLMGDGKEEHFGKTAIICSKCGLVNGYSD